MKNYLKPSIVALGLVCLASCKDDDPNSVNDLDVSESIVLESHSVTPSFLKTTPEFKDVEIYPLLSSEDKLEESPEFVYGSMADGAGLLKNEDGTFTLINNIEADYSIARVTLDATFRPVKGEYILNAAATANTAQCSGSLITPEEHGFGPWYLSGGEWGGSSKGVFLTDPYKTADTAEFGIMLNAMGQWSTENAVAIGKDAYPNKTVVFIGDDHSNNEMPSGQLGMYVGARGELNNGTLHALRVTQEGINFEMDMEEGTSYPIDFVELEEREIDLLDAEAKTKGAMGFSRLEDIDWRRGSASNNRELYFCVTGRKKEGLKGKGTLYGRIYKVVLNENDPTKAGTITCILDGDKIGGKAEMFHSPDNILVTENYAYIQEDPNGYFDGAHNHYARLYQYDLRSGSIKTVLECDQVAAEAQNYGPATKAWEITGMIDISDIINEPDTYIMITQNHGWEKEGVSFTDPNANPDLDNRKEGSVMYIVKGLAR